MSSLVSSRDRFQYPFRQGGTFSFMSAQLAYQSAYAWDSVLPAPYHASFPKPGPNGPGLSHAAPYISSLEIWNGCLAWVAFPARLLHGGDLSLDLSATNPKPGCKDIARGKSRLKKNYLVKLRIRRKLVQCWGSFSHQFSCAQLLWLTFALRRWLPTPLCQRDGVGIDTGLLSLSGRVVHTGIACIQFTTNQAQQDPLERVVKPPVSDRVDDGV